ncbi:FadR/GntR family transcriptional regulator [Ectobacillus panaciterrae]|uniref:FadR/GntR family transcriptional regulator n=1 Tax=Ectobacillus panaciterrae TaxID=363872 RepID=UPI000423016A|nr:GntR family transcriptional regulator [Ectobacillus panaciterrae]
MDKIKLNPVQRLPRTFEQVSKQIVNYLTSEKLSNRSKLPTERTLSTLLGVSRSSLREGLRVLELLGYLDSRQGEGTFVSEPPPFIVPSRVLTQKLDPASLKHYYEISIMCAEQIVMLSLQESIDNNIFKSKSNSPNNFWSEFAYWIESLSSQLQNPYFLSLWQNTYHLLIENNYFLHRDAPVEINTFVESFAEKDESKLKQLLFTLSRIT